MPTIDLILPRPHPAQRKILSERTRFNVVCCGRRFGKSVMGVNIAIPPALEGYPVGWFAPTYKYLTEVWIDFERILKPVTARINRTERRIELITGGVIEFWSLEDEDAGRSRKYKQVVIDEAAKVKNLESRWDNAIRATLADFRGSADFLSTPKGKNFFWKAFTWGQDKHDPEWTCWQLPTRSNPYIDADEIEAARRKLPERVYAQEFLAMFLEDAGGIFRKVAEAVDAGRTADENPAIGRQYSMGVDLARVEDFTVISVFDDSGRQVYHDRFNQISWERQLSSIKAVSEHYKATVYLDSTGVGDPPFEWLRKAGVRVTGYQFTNASKESLIDNLAMRIEQNQVRLMDVQDQTNELLAYEYELTPSRNVRMNAPEGMHDDCVISLALAAWGLNRASTGPILSASRPPAIATFRVR